MPFTLTMPKLSPTMEEGSIVKWHKKEGDFVKADELLFEAATDKATVEYNALDAGYLRKILVQENQVTKVNRAVAIFTETADESIEGYTPDGIQDEAKVATPESAEVAEGAPATKATSVQGVAFIPEPPLENYEYEWQSGEPVDRLKASPLARKMAKEKGVDLLTVKGSGPDNRIVAKDLEMAQPASVVAFGRHEKPLEIPGSYEEIPLSPMRKVIGDRLQASKMFIPHFYVQQDIDMGAAVSTYEQLKKEGIKVTYNDMVVRAASLALREYPSINCGFNSETNAIIQFKTIDICIAVSVDGGLITPIIRHADYKNMGQLSKEVRHLATLAKKGKLAPEQYKGGSFTISNLGMFGITDFQAVINPPQAAILAVGGIIDKPLVKEGTLCPGKVMTLSLASDHRVIDGADAARFLKRMKELLECPSLLLI